jgi:hypothetical protein
MHRKLFFTFITFCTLNSANPTKVYDSQVPAPLDYLAVSRKFVLPSAEVLDGRLQKRFGILDADLSSLGQLLGEQKISPLEVYIQVGRYLSDNINCDYQDYDENPHRFIAKLLMAHALFMQQKSIVCCILEDSPYAIQALEKAGLLKVYVQRASVINVSAPQNNHLLEADPAPWYTF